MNITLAIHRHALRQPNKPAVLAGQQKLTYRELDRCIWNAAAHFHAQGVKAEDRVALVLADQLLYVITSLGLARLGVAYLAVAPAEGAILGSLMHRIGA